MKGTLRALAALMLALVWTGTAAYAASDTTGNQVTRWDAVWDLQADGSAEVTIDFDFDFGDDPGHGPYLTFPTEVDYGDGVHTRLFDVHDIRVGSPSGAPAQAYVDESGGAVTIRIGDEDVDDVSGTQRYVLAFTVDHVMNATTAAELGGEGDQIVQDELFTNVVGTDWTIPLSDITVTIESPVEVLDLVCWAGDAGSDQRCGSSEHEGSSAVVTQERLEPYQGLTVAVAYPPGSFDTTPELVERRTFVGSLGLGWYTVGAAVLLLALGVGLVVRYLRRNGLDVEYDQVTPGLAPTLGATAPVRTRDRKAPVAVQFEPPAGLRPGLLGTLIDEKADTRDVTATMIDLAVRGYLSIEPVGDLDSKDGDFTLTRQRDADGALAPYERLLFDALFDGRDAVTLDDLRTTFAEDMEKVQKSLYDEVTVRGWFKGDPHKARSRWAGLGALLLLAGVGVTVLLALSVSLGVLGLPLAIVGVVVLATTGVAPARTAEGSRVLAQTRGFELYLATAEADQIRFEEGHDIFSRYLPYAIAFGHTERWVSVFEKLAARGVSLPEPTWYHGYAYGAFWMYSAGLSHRIERFESLASNALTAPTPGSSGGSGFSGGSVGGGSFGGGGGGW
ncbi:DUF2207 domain-containing protein [Demequina zhanjiangensis]|uniref:DUF2207 domain-containing protein n=1 Tax=Demequina zhanjiangensis TaxID=3051659 RepID=A0ABT8G1A4_9MICO|nr:DUF2207 domain-containing protein [Demequina sp. SYSU T00b26]MDN4472898.1 DUF2207 domain-containing protein [Demequina sp. SYSU T00b26]